MELRRWIRRDRNSAGKTVGYLVQEGTTIGNGRVVAFAMTRWGAKRRCGSMYIDIMDVPDPLFDAATAKMKAYENSDEYKAEQAAWQRRQDMLAQVVITQTGPAAWHIKGYRDER